MICHIEKISKPYSTTGEYFNWLRIAIAHIKTTKYSDKMSTKKNRSNIIGCNLICQHSLGT